MEIFLIQPNRYLYFSGSQLKVVATLSVGFDHIDIEECHRRNILIGYTPEVLTMATAELAVALLLATSRNIPNGRYCFR